MQKKIYRAICGTIVLGYGSYEDCVAAIEWCESEGAPSTEMRIEEC